MVNKRIARGILHALEGGMVPENGLPYIAVGRKEEIEVITRDMDRIAEGYSTFRLLEGAYGSGKSFMARLIKNEALLRGFVVMDCELAPERKLCGTQKQGLETYRVLLSSLSTRSMPAGHALEEILDSYVEELKKKARQKSPFEERITSEDIMQQAEATRQVIQQMPHGFDFYDALIRYILASLAGQAEEKEGILRWFRGEYANKTTAKKTCGLPVIIEDGNWFAYIKIWAIFIKEAGYTGSYLILDELTQITRNIVNATTREHNFERLLSMYNDCYGNGARYMGIILCGIPSSIHDSKRGIFSYEALKSRLDVSELQGEEILGSPIIKLSMLSPEEFTALLETVEKMYHMLQEDREDVTGEETYFTEEERITFVNYEYRRIGAANHLTPREFLRDFLTVLNLKSTSRKEDSIEDFLYKGSGLALSPSMIGEENVEIDDFEEDLKYEGFIL